MFSFFTKKVALFFFCFNLGLFLDLLSEIEKATVTWTPILCSGSCVKTLERHFSKIKDIANISINQQVGMAELSWKPNASFNFTSIATAMGLVGLSIRDIRVKVRGTIRVSGKNYRVISLGDNTPFVLLNSVTPYRGTYVVEFNPANRELRPEMRQRLHEAQKKNQVAIIEGPLFMPERAPPFMIVVDQIKFIDKIPSKNQLKRR
ncbi:Uncharacterized protein PHSC3_000663 [Chlamydiales bacterium STE3]|nr:Uncharacterized protein PHSC3_000663 [Chlamydiales bacterium STE3]